MQQFILRGIYLSKSKMSGLHLSNPAFFCLNCYVRVNLTEALGHHCGLSRLVFYLDQRRYQELHTDAIAVSYYDTCAMLEDATTFSINLPPMNRMDNRYTFQGNS